MTGASVQMLVVVPGWGVVRANGIVGTKCAELEIPPVLQHVVVGVAVIV